jgi:hypothetical protein
MVDPVPLALVHILVKLLSQRSGGGTIVAERLLQDDAPGLGQAGISQPFTTVEKRKGGISM